VTGNAWQDRYYTSADGLRLYYRDYPSPGSSRLPVLCLPGLTRNSRDFETIAPRIAQGRRVLCADLRGRGRSQHDPKRRAARHVTGRHPVDADLGDATCGRRRGRAE
jgi:pimeloyl-ACP methyl ester carboxylesterase